MKEFLLGIAIAGALVATFLMLPKPKETIPVPVYDLYVHWKKEHSRLYGSNDEDKYRANVFYENWKKIKEHNEDPSQTYEMGINQFMDLTPEEFQSFYLGLLQQPQASNWDGGRMVNRPETWDWRKQPGDVIRQVKDQKQCGSCWAFSATGALEGLATIKKGIHDEFSEQQLVDCSTKYGNHGCRGGLMTYAFQYVRDKGITTEEDYPYVARDQPCKKDGGAFKISGFQNLPKGDINVQADTVVTQPVSIASDASNWSFYKGGIFSNCGTRLNHGILLVGYDKEAWYVKNSWGLKWGENGYIRLKWGDTCGCADMSTIPLI